MNTAEERVRDGARLLADLLLHEARPAALLGGGSVPGHLEGLGRGGLAVEVDDLDRVGTDRDDLVLPDLHGLTRVLDECRDIGAEEVLAVAEADHERGVPSRADDDARHVLVHDEQGERAVQAADRGSERLGEIAGLPVGVAHEQGCDLGVRLAREDIAGVEKLLFEVGEVLDDAVVDEGELAVVTEVRVSIAIGGSTVCRPTGVADSGVTVGQRVGREILGEDAELAGVLAVQWPRQSRFAS